MLEGATTPTHTYPLRRMNDDDCPDLVFRFSLHIDLEMISESTIVIQLVFKNPNHQKLESATLTLQRSSPLAERKKADKLERFKAIQARYGRNNVPT